MSAPRKDFRIGLGRARDVERDVNDEFQFHLAMRVAELVGQGLSPEAARAEAERQFGDVEDARRYCRDEDLDRSRRERWQGTARDLPALMRQATRALRRSPIITAAAVFCLALGIGATTAVFSAVHTALLRPLPFAAPEELITVFRTTPNFDTGPFSNGVYNQLARQSTTLAGLAAVATGNALLAGTERTDRVATARVTGNLLPLLGVAAEQGRLIGPDDDRDGAPPVAMVSAEFWRNQLGARPDVVGSTIRLDGLSYSVAGVLPRGFKVPHGGFMIAADVVLPMRFTNPDQIGSNYLLTMGRLRPGVSREAAEAELKGLMAGIAETSPQLKGEQLRIVSMHRQSMDAVRTPLMLMLGAAGCVLLIACANVAALLLARGIERQREIAIRAAVGAARSRVVGHVLLETALLGLAGVSLGVGVAWVGVETLGASAAERMPQLAGFTIDPRMLLFAVVAGAMVTLLCGIVPAWRAAAVDPQDALRAGGRSGGDRGQHRMLRVLVAGEVSLSLMLLLGAGLVLRGFSELINRDPGFEPDHLLTMSVSLDPQRYQEGATSYRTFLVPVLEAIRAIPGVEEAGTINLIPYDNWGWNFGIAYEGGREEDPSRRPLTEIRYASPSLFATLGVPLIRGRLLDDADRDSTGAALPYVVVNQALVDRDFPNADPIGKRFGWGSDDQWATIIGVVGNTRNSGPVNAPRPEVVFSSGGATATVYPLVIRVAGNPSSAAAAVQAAVRGVDPGVAISLIRPMPEVIERSVGRPRFIATLLLLFAGVAVVLTCSGLYGLMSYSVAQRTREIGIRTALGSSAGQTVSLVLRQGMALVVVGVMLGLAGGMALTRLLTSLLFGVSPFDLAAWVGGSLLLLLVAATATVVPARRAARVDPLIAIRAE